MITNNMGNKLINKEISELKNLIKTNSKDAQYADILADYERVIATVGGFAGDDTISVI